MRPVTKWIVGHTNPSGKTVSTVYSPHGLAKPLLEENLDDFCNYCEVFSSDTEVEHIVSKDEKPTLSTHWTNFLIACGRCNGGDNKSNKPVDLSAMYFPHLNNTLLVFKYREGGFVEIHPNLSAQHQKDKANALLNLVGLDKHPDNTKYPATAKHPQGFPINDKRWEHRRAAWEKAERKLVKYERGEISAETVAKFAHERGFFSVWFSVFGAHRAVKEALVNIFKGTARDCFDADFNPIPRNPSNLIDPI
jgi:uncharacterized protein (TIGR02646 family)